MADPKDDPSTLSAERLSMDGAWTLISDVLGGAAQIRSKGEAYLPKYEKEGRLDYQRRLKTAPWRPEFDDALRTLVSKPFAKDVALKGDTSKEIKNLAEDVDGRGNNLTAFARELFLKAVGKGLHLLLVDYPSMEPNATRAQEQAAGARPYWVHIEADALVALYTRWEGGREIVSHVRFRETFVEREGFAEKRVERIRVYEPGKWEIWTRSESTKEFSLADHGLIARGPSGQSSVPIVLFYTGERSGEITVKPPLVDLAQLQIELYQALSRQDEVLTFAGSPMLAAQGMGQPTIVGQDGVSVPIEITVGPKSVLFAPPNGDGTPSKWGFIQPDAANIKEIRSHVESIIADMRRLGMQPLTRSTRATATGDAIDAAKSHSAVQAWAMGLKDALEQAWLFTSEWIGGEANVECVVWTDFSVMPFADAPLQALDKGRARRDISLETYWDGLRRFDVLMPDFDPAVERSKVEAEWKEYPATVERDPATGRKVDVSTGQSGGAVE